MATKEVMVVTPEELKNLVPSEKAMEAYRFALANAGIEMDEEITAEFIIQSYKGSLRDEVKLWG
ncbi:hypothetical protein [uncultured Fibrobacter sp.]|uniref:hypothetical protein n=1 Tax=uncultured Fibrobacter sp. TaxID=261512 RepID=UPI0025F27D8C|nr:hypothetical protein [uncultured Fibrobacter sp.]